MLKPANLIGSLFVLLVICASAALGQTGTSGISGTVRDVNGAVVPNATVTAKSEATNVSQNQNTTDAGLYAFTSLPVGNYTISVEKSGFKTFKKTGNVLEEGTPLTVDATMEVGAVSETVTVTGGTEQLQTANATIGNVVEQKAIEALPLNGRNPLTLLLLEPGVVQRSFGGAASGVHVNGARDRAYNVTIDGIEANEPSVPNPVSNLYRTTPDNIQEYKGTTNNATAEEGRNSAASISIATRAGTSEPHGIFRYFGPDAANPLVSGGTTITRNRTLLVDPSTGVPVVPNCATATSLRCIRTYSVNAGSNNPIGRPLDSTVAGLLKAYPS